MLRGAFEAGFLRATFLLAGPLEIFAFPDLLEAGFAFVFDLLFFLDFIGRSLSLGTQESSYARALSIICVQMPFDFRISSTVSRIAPCPANGNAACAKTSRMRESESLAIMRVKCFDFEGDLLSLGKKV